MAGKVVQAPEQKDAPDENTQPVVESKDKGEGQAPSSDNALVNSIAEMAEKMEELTPESIRALIAEEVAKMPVPQVIMQAEAAPEAPVKLGKAAKDLGEFEGKKLFVLQRSYWDGERKHQRGDKAYFEYGKAPKTARVVLD